MPVHLRPSAPTAPMALLCGDPARALAIAQRVLIQPRMSNHHRGLWGYHGETAAGLELTVQSTGIGGPSAAIVLGELAGLGLRAAIRVGTCTTAGASPDLGSGVVVGSAVARDGTSLALGSAAGSTVEPDEEMTGLLSAAMPGPRVTVVSRDLPHERIASTEYTDEGSVADLQSAPLMLACGDAGVAVAVVLAVARARGRRLEDEPLEATLLQLADVAVVTLETLSLRSRLRS